MGQGQGEGEWGAQGWRLRVGSLERRRSESGQGMCGRVGAGGWARGGQDVSWCMSVVHLLLCVCGAAEALLASHTSFSLLTT